MRIDSFRLNDWQIRNFLLVVLVVQLAVLVTSILGVFGHKVPILGQVAGFGYLAFIPGFILLRVFRVHNLSTVESLLYAVGLSLSFSMILGLTMNSFFPYVGISEPISTISLVLTMSGIILALAVLSFARDKDFTSPNSNGAQSILSSTTFALCLLPFLSIFGTYLMNFMDHNVLLLALLLAISIVPIIAMFDLFPKRLYPLAIYMIALSLLYHNSLISTYLTGWDIHSEYYFASLVQSNSHWVSSLQSNYNGMLSVVMLAPIFSSICNMSLVWVFKAIYPILFSFVPLGLYRVFRTQTGEKTAFLACFFFMSVFTFYTEMLAIARQQIAEIFQVLLMLLMINRSINTTEKSVLGIIFAFSLVTSHYGLSYIFMFSLIIVWIILFSKKWEEPIKGIANSLAFVSLYVTLALTWYVHVSSSSIFDFANKLGNQIVGNMADFLNPTAVEGLDILVTTRTTSFLREVAKILYLMVNFFVSAGILVCLRNGKKMKFAKTYLLFSAVNFAMCLAGMTVPYFAGALNTSRLYQISLLFLAPFCVLGGKAIFSRFGRTIKTSWENKESFLKVLSVFFAVFFLFNSGFIYEIARDHPNSISLNKDVDFPRFNQQEISSIEWLRDGANRSIPVYSDSYRSVLVKGLMSACQYFRGSEETTSSIPQIAYFFLGSQNIETEKILFVTDQGPNYIDIQDLALHDSLLRSSKIYDSGGAQIYYSR